MQSLFVPTPDWLDRDRELIESGKFFPDPQSFKFVLGILQYLYTTHAGLTDRQVIEFVSLIQHLSLVDCFHLPLERGVKTSSFWYYCHYGFCLSFGSLVEKVDFWIERNLPGGHTFWHGDLNWWHSFIFSGVSEFKMNVEYNRCRMAQHCLGIFESGSWDAMSKEKAQKFQRRYPKTLLPWRDGKLDGFTYRFLIKCWKKRLGIA